MRSAISMFLVVLFSQVVYGQAPELFSYQAVACNSNGSELTNQDIGVRFTILQTDPNGTPLYFEEHISQTDEFGLFALNVGDGGTSSTGDFSAINWNEGPFFLQVELDASLNGTFNLLSNTQLLSVPYSLYANQADKANQADTSLYSNRAFIADSTLNDNDPDPTNELQTIDFSNGELSLSGANSIAFSTDDADSDPTNEIQSIDFDGESLVLNSPGGGSDSVSLYSGLFSRPGASFAYPQGILGEYVTITTENYMVPSGKSFYITSIENAVVEAPGLSNFFHASPNMPVITGGTPLTDCDCTGFLVDQSSDIDVILINFDVTPTYVVPQGKTLILKSGFDSSEDIDLIVNSKPIRFEKPTATKTTSALIFSEGSILELNNNLVALFTGYLINN